VRERVHTAVLELLGEQRWDEITIPQVADRSGVHQATIYRRWGSVSVLVDDVATAQLTAAAPLPDTGTLRGDLEIAAVRFAEAIAGQQGHIFLRAAALSAPTDRAPAALRTRAEQLQQLLDRAHERGEQAPTLVELLESITAPLYCHPLFFGRPADATHARELVDRLMTIVDARGRWASRASYEGARSNATVDCAATASSD
jgi:AcrR family transcriptional regulator